MQSARLTIWVLGALCALSGTSCQQETATPAEERVEVSYAQTQCADKWGQASSIQQLQAVASAYLTQQGITGHQLQASVQSQGAVCNACTCPTGLVLSGTARKADLPTLLALGFTKR